MRKASFGGIFGELFALLGDTRNDFGLYTLVIGGISALGVFLGLSDPATDTLGYGFAVDANDTPASALFELVEAIVSVVGTYLLLTRFLAARGRWHPGGTRFWHYLGCAILSVLGAILGLIVFIVPGIMLLVRWSAASGFVIGARQGITDSLGASWHATQGSGWAIFFAALVLFFGVAVAAGIIEVIAAAISAEVGAAVGAFVEAAAGAVFAALGIAIYNLVHDDGEAISEVFA